MVREITALHFFPSFLPLFPASSGVGTPESSSGICDNKGGDSGTLVTLPKSEGGPRALAGNGVVGMRGPVRSSRLALVLASALLICNQSVIEKNVGDLLGPRILVGGEVGLLY